MATQMVNEEMIQDIMDAVHDTLRDHSVEVDDFESIENDIEAALKSKLRQAGVYDTKRGWSVPEELRRFKSASKALLEIRS